MRWLMAAMAAMATSAIVAFAQTEGARDTDVRSFADVRERIDESKELTSEQKSRLHEIVNSAESETTVIHDATQKVLDMAVTDSRPIDAAQRAEIESKVKDELARIGASHASLGTIQNDLMSEIEAAKDLTPKQKAEIKATLQKLSEKRISLQEAIASLNLDGAGRELIIVLFIVLIIVGAGFG